MELLDGADVPLPDNVRDAVLLQAADLSDDARTAAIAAAVVGQIFDPELVRAVAGLDTWPDELLRRGIITEDPAGRMAFRHALVRDAFYSDIPWTTRIKLHRAVAQRLDTDRGAAAVVPSTGYWADSPTGRGRHCCQQQRRSARCTLTATVHAASGAHWSCGPRNRTSSPAWTGSSASPAALSSPVISGMRRRSGARSPANVSGKAIHSDSVTRNAGWQLCWNFRVVGRRRWPAGNMLPRHLPQRRHRRRPLLNASLQRLICARQGVSAQHSACWRPRDSRPAPHSVDLQARILGHVGNARARMGQGQQGVELVRAGLAMALEHGLTGPAAEIYQRLADALEHAGDYTGASATYDEAYSFCSANGLEPTAQLCLACLTAVLRQSGDWDRSATLCQRVIESSDATVHARAVVTGMLGSIFGVRGRTRQARPLLLESATLARQLELAAMELVSSWGLAIVDSVEGATQSAVGHCWALLERWKQTEDRHYAMPPLRWATTFFAESGDAAGTRACAAALAQIAADAGQDEAMSALSHGLGESALIDGSLDQAAEQFSRALVLLQGHDAPFERAESERRLASVLVATGRLDEASRASPRRVPDSSPPRREATGQPARRGPQCAGGSS
ncbi:MAG TPA: hypothetical protein VJ820_08980, partial [Propionibacteriaceae bacterium]|nr:hypothetical protein [Propionibacteriaceae bacterium]